MVNLVTLTIRSTHYYLFSAGQGFFMVDAGWAGELAALKSQLRRAGVDLSQIRYLMLTHHHPDHAGLAQEIKQACGAHLVILERQVPFLEELARFYAGKKVYVPIRIEAGDLVLPGSNRADLARIGVQGEIVETPGHSDDSVSLVLDSGLAFTGDLLPPDLTVEAARPTTLQSWQTLLDLNVKTVYPAHGDAFPIERVRQSVESPEG